MIKKPPPENSVNISIVECRGQGVDLATVLEGFNRMKAELEAMGCTVTIDVDGMPIEYFGLVEAEMVEVSNPEVTDHA